MRITAIFAQLRAEASRIGYPRNAYGIIRHSTLWLKPVLVGQFEFVEWTPDGHLRHSAFVGMREDKKPKEVKRE